MTEYKEVKHHNVYEAIARVQGNLAKEGISKDRSNKEQGYKFRGIDDLYNALAGHLSEAGLCILPRILSRDLTQRTTSKGNPLFSVVVEAEFDFVSARDGSKHTVRTYGEAMDTADKATNKAMSAAYKYACLQTFCIPTEGDNDADGTTPDVGSQQKGEFESPELRVRFEAECLNAINVAINGADIHNVKISNQAKWNAMKDSKCPADFESYNRIVNAYNDRYTALKERAEKAKQEAAKVKAGPKTVEAAKQNPASVLSDDEIPY